MADISTYLDQILTAIYGEDVRTSIHHAIRDMNSQLNTAASTTLNALGFRGDLGTSDGTTYNLNSLTATDRRGIWRLQANRNYTNAPDDYDQTKTGYLIVYSFGAVDSTASNIKQEIHYFSDSGANANVCWSRVYISNSWTEWKKNVDNTLSTEGAAADALVVGTRLNNIMNKWALMSYIEPITSDIDDKIAQGIYYVWRSTVPNWPFDTTGLLLILNAHNQNRETSGPSAGALVQMAFVDGAMAYRMYGTNGWGDWKHDDTDDTLAIEGRAADAKAVGDKALISKQAYLPVGDNANLNNFYEQGIYSLMTPQGTQNWPFGNSWGIFVVLNANNATGSFSAYSVVQLAFCEGKYAFRTSIAGQSGPSYSDWIIYEIDDTLSVEGAVADAKAVGDAISGAVESVVSSKGLAMSTDPEHPVKDLNDYKTPGIYYVGATRVTNWAFDDNYRGVLVVFNPMTSAAAMTDSIVQMAFSNGELAYRMFNGYGAGQTELWSDWIKNDNSRLLDIIENIADIDSVQNEIEATVNQNYYLEKTSATTCTVKSSTGTELVLYSVAVTAKKNYRITASNVASIDNAILAFATRALADNVGCTMLIDNTGGPTIDYSYSPTQNGYLFLSKGTNANMTYKIYEVEDQASLIVDKDLTEEGVPADAKAVGDIVIPAAKSSEVYEAEATGYANVNTGAVIADNRYRNVKVSLCQNSYVLYKAGTTESVAGLVFYDADGNFLEGHSGTAQIQLLKAPENATYALASYSVASTEFDVKLYLNFEEIAKNVNALNEAEKSSEVYEAEATGYANVNTGAVIADDRYRNVKVALCQNSYVLYKAGTTETVAGLVFYDADGNFLEGHSGTAYDMLLKAPEYTTYALASYSSSSTDFHAKLYLNFEEIAKNVNTLNEMEAITSESLAKYRNSSGINIDLSSGYAQGYIRVADGTVANDNRYRHVEAFVTEGDAVSYTAGVNMQSVMGLSFYDADKAYIGTSYGATMEEQVITVPAGAYFIRASFDNSIIDAASLSLFKIGTQFILADPDDGVTGYVNANTGAIVYDDRYKYVRVPVYPGDVVEYGIGYNEGFVGVAFYNRDGYYIDGKVGTKLLQSHIVPDDTSYALATYALNNISSFKFATCSTDMTLEKAKEVLYSSVADSKTVTVGPDGADYTSILRALKETTPNTKVIIKTGVYDVLNEYTDYYGSSFWQDYDGYANHRDDPFYRGLWIDSGRVIVGDVGVIIDCRYTGSNSAVNTYFSVFANNGNIKLENVTIKYSNLRYAIHDDYGPQNQTVIFKDIHFIPGSDTTGIGAGCGFDSKYFIEGCTFEPYENTVNSWDINYHNNGGQSLTNKCEIRVTNCYGHRGCGFWSLGESDEFTECYVSNSKFNKIDCYTIPGYSGKINMHLTEWCNEVDQT